MALDDNWTYTEGTKDTEPLELTRAGRSAIALVVGLVLGALGLAVYALAVRVPADQTSTYSAPLGHQLLISLGALTVAGLATLLLCRRAVSGKHIAGLASILLAVVVAITAYSFIAAEPSRLALLASGPGARPVVVLAQASWAVLACGLLLLVGATSASGEDARSPGRASIAGFVVTGAVLAAVTGVVISLISSVGASHATTAARIPIPPLPTSVGNDVAYTVKIDSGLVLPAGPGFAVLDDDAAVGYDGATGGERWRFPRTDLPAKCDNVSLRSTGIGDDAVVVLQCSRPPNDQGSDRYNSDRKGYVPFLVGLDATTGQRLWVNDEDWWLRGRANIDADVLAAVSPDQVAALDPRTGKVLWAKGRPDDDCSSSEYQPIGASILFADACRKSVHVYDADSDSRIDLTEQRGFPGSEGHFDVMAVDGSTLLIRAEDTNRRGDVLVTIDAATKHVQITPVGYVRPPQADALIPGSAVETSNNHDAQTVELFLPAEQRTVTVTGVRMFQDPREQRWARVGNEFVTAAAYQGEYDDRLATVAITGGPATTRPNPCGKRTGRVVPVPGAVLLLCANSFSNDTVTSADVLGLR